eukprot:COSAG05_NODE_13579_length_424_cov_1.633846_1_plen_81_part_00
MSNVVVDLALAASPRAGARDDNEDFQMPSTLLNVSTGTEQSETAGGLSDMDSFHDDPQAEILRLRALLRQRDDTIRQRDA